MTTPQRIAILGGGCGSIAAAFALTNEPGWRERYDITLYQLGWRLGGKGASGRNAEYNERIQEHGIHMWNGFYENAFEVMQQAYAECGRSPGAPLATWTEAFKQRNQVVYDEDINGRHAKWGITFPINDAVPGDGREFPELYNYIVMALEWLLEVVPGNTEKESSVVARFVHKIEHAFAGAGSHALVHFDKHRLRKAHGHAVDMAKSGSLDEKLLVKLIEHLTAFVEHLVQDAEEALRLLDGDNPKFDWLRRLLSIADLTLAAIHGILHDGIITHGYSAIDHLDFRQWLRNNGASESAVQIGPIKALYDAMFAYRRGDPTKPGISAGSTLQGALRLFLGYKGSLYYQMQAGMGDAVFGPFYTALKNRGVKFKFFHQVTNLGLSADKTDVDTITMRQQVRTHGDKPYEPFRVVQGLDCWPSEPLWDQIQDADKVKGRNFELPDSPYVREFSLRRGVDFDLVVLGIPVGAHKLICSELLAANADWAQMVDKLDIVPTTGTQLWFRPSWAQLGYPDPPTVGAGYTYPLSIWADSTELLPRANWPANYPPGAICYLCGTFHWTETALPVIEQATQDRANAQAYDQSVQWLSDNANLVWADGVQTNNPTELNWDLLYDRSEARGKERMRSQFAHANVSPSELYVGCWPDTNQYRLEAGGSGFTSLFLAGDWIQTGYNMGFVEAAVIGGLFCSRAISGYPTRIVGEP